MTTTEISRLADLMNAGRYSEAEGVARTLLDRTNMISLCSSPDWL